MHTVQTGESLSLIAETYQTTIDVIRASNVLIEGASVWPGTVLIILPYETRPESVERYIAILVEKSTSVESLAEEHGSTPDQIRYLNDLGDDGLIPSDRIL